MSFTKMRKTILRVTSLVNHAVEERKVIWSNRNKGRSLTSPASADILVVKTTRDVLVTRDRDRVVRPTVTLLSALFLQQLDLPPPGSALGGKEP
jgi:hypothetical protein